MPLTKAGSKVMSAMMGEYGAEKGKKVFYASMNKGNPGSTKWHGKKSRKRNMYAEGLRK